MYTLSEEPKEYVRNCRMLNGELKNIVDTHKLNISLLANASDFIKDRLYVSVVHDVSPIRKPESQKLDKLGKVKDLSGALISGYETFDSITVDMKTKEIRLLACQPFSNGDDAFVGSGELALYETGQLKDATRRLQIEAHLLAGSHYNLKSLLKQQTRQISEHIRSVNPGAIIVDIYDRGFDDVDLFEHEQSLGNLFIIRAKSNRKGDEISLDQSNKPQSHKLSKQHFQHGDQRHYDKVRFRNRVFQNATSVFEYHPLTLKDKPYSVVRVSFFTRTGQRIFKEPMLLLTNLQVDRQSLAELVFEFYMQRSIIESVFKFCKQTLGWEKPRMNDFNAMKNLMSLVFFIAGYFYQIKDPDTHDPTASWLAQLGGGKGRVSTHFLIEGIRKLVIFQQMKQFIQEHKLSEEDIKHAIRTYST